MQFQKVRAGFALAALVSFIGLLADAGRARAEYPQPDRVSQWMGYERRDFQVAGRECLLVLPKEPAKGNPWIWRTEFFGHEPQADLALLAKGFHVAYMDLQNMYGAPVALDLMDQFHAYLTRARGLRKATVLEGFSRGGLFSLNWAARNPLLVSCIYNDAPVCDFKSWPGGRGKGKGSPGDWKQCLAAYKLTEQEALEYKLNPVDNLEPLARGNVPLLHVCGAADDVVPFEENTRLVEKRLRELGGRIDVIAKPGVGHHPHSLVDPTPIVAFVMRHTTGDGPAACLIKSPVEYQVFQRSLRNAGEIRIEGTLLGPADSAQARVVQTATADSPEQVIVNWRSIGFIRGSSGVVFHRTLTVPAGGWYRVELRGMLGDKPTATSAVEHVGVGEVFVIAGQSNSTNYGSEKQTPKSNMVSSFDGANWAPAKDPQPGVQDGSGGGSFVPAFGDALFERFQVPIGVASTGAGATSVRQWLPKGEQMKNLPTIAERVREVSPGVWESDGALFDGLMRRVQLLGPQGCRAVLWHQGESDAGQARAGYPADRQISGEQYRQFMEKLINASRASAKWQLPWITAQATYHSEQDAAYDEFRQAQAALWQSKLANEGPDTDALRQEFRDGVHFNAKGQIAHGKLWADKAGVFIDAQLQR